MDVTAQLKTEYIAQIRSLSVILSKHTEQRCIDKLAVCLCLVVFLHFETFGAATLSINH